MVWCKTKVTRDRCNNLLSRPGSSKKSAMIYLECVPPEQMTDTIRKHDCINKCPTILRNSLLNVHFNEGYIIMFKHKLSLAPTLSDVHPCDSCLPIGTSTNQNAKLSAPFMYT